MKQFTSIHDIENPGLLVAEGLYLKQHQPDLTLLGRGKTLGLVFMNPSLRTRLSTYKAGKLLGMDVLVMNMDKESWQIEWQDGAIMDGGKVEHIRDAAAVLGQYCDIIGLRSFPSLTDRDADYSEHILRQLQKYCNVPVVSLESATLHPLQSLADAITIHESWKEKRKPRVVLTWAPHIKPLPQAVANSFSQWMTQLNVDFVITHPEGYELDTQFTRGAEIITSQDEALKKADFVYLKSWSSFRQYGQLLPVSGNWALTPKKYDLTNEAFIMHCLPVRREVELSSTFADHAKSLLQHQAINRLYAAEAVLKRMLETMHLREAAVKTASLSYSLSN